MKQFVTMVAFSVSSVLSFSQPINPTPLEAIAIAPTVKVFFDATSDEAFLTSVKQALAARDIILEYSNVNYDESGKLTSISFMAMCEDQPCVETTVEVTDHQGAYLFIDFGSLTA
jgi:hypothetical protein